MQLTFLMVAQNGFQDFSFLPIILLSATTKVFILGEIQPNQLVLMKIRSLIYIEKDEFKNLLDTNPRFERTVRILAEESYIQSMARIHSFQSLNAEQRIRKFFAENPELGKKLTTATYCILPWYSPQYFNKVSFIKSKKCTLTNTHERL